MSLLTADSGLVDVFVFGGPKSKLRSLASPYAEGRAFVYADPVKDFRKLSDFDVSRSNPGLREKLDRLWSAGLVAEVLMKTSGGGGDFAHVRELAATTFARLSEAGEEETDYPLMLFLWRLLSVLGLGPDPGECVKCGVPFSRTAPSCSDCSPHYSQTEEGFLCASCARKVGYFQYQLTGMSRGKGDTCRMAGIIPITAGTLQWLSHADRVSFDEALGAKLDRESLGGLRELLFFLAGRAADSPLLSLGTNMMRSVTGN